MYCLLVISHDIVVIMTGHPFLDIIQLSFPFCRKAVPKQRCFQPLALTSTVFRFWAPAPNEFYTPVLIHNDLLYVLVVGAETYTESG